MTKEEAIKIVRNIYQTGTEKEALATLIPELAESEDERIRKAIESVIRVYGKTQGEWIAGYDMDTLVVHLRDAFAYLEKQKEQKPAEYGTRAKIISRATSEKQVVLLSESNGSAEIGWDTRSLEDAKNLLEYGLAFINREIEKIAGLGSGPDYATTEGRYNHLFKQ